MATLRLQFQSKLIFNTTLTRNLLRVSTTNEIIQQSCRRKHVLCFKTNESVFRNFKRFDATRIILNSNILGAERLASTFVVETKPSTTNVEESGPVNSLAVDELTLPPVPEPAVVSDVVQAVGEPTFSSLGLGGWSPVGMVQQSLEYVHVVYDLPWWATIMIGTVVLRTLVFPLVILAQRNAAKMNNVLPEMQHLQVKLTEARQSGNQFESARYAQELLMFMKEKGISPIKNMLPPLAQAPLFISMFMGLRGMTNVPVDSLRTGGLFWFEDLTVPDQFFILPFLTSFTLWVTIEVGTDSGKLTANNMQFMKYILRAMPVIVFPFTMNFPGAILCYWVSTNFISLLQVGFLRIPRVREYFKIPPIITYSKESLPIKDKGFIKGFKESMANVKITRELQEREHFDAVQFTRAGRAPIQRTFKFDPTKAPPTAAEVLAKKRD